MNAARKLILFSVAVFVAMTTGCGKKTVQVNGSVTYRNKPLPAAKIIFIDTAGKATSGDIQEGKFSVSNVPLGEGVKVVVATTPLANEIMDFEERKRMQTAAPLPPGQKPPPEPQLTKDASKGEAHLGQIMKDLKDRLIPVPSRYETAETTPLTITIGKELGELSIKLEE